MATPSTPEEITGQEDRGPEKSFVPPFPWERGLQDSSDLSTKRGFVFQFPPFPTLSRVGEEVAEQAVPTGLYVHIPFCPYRCSYCYYAVEVNQPQSAVDEYLETVELEMARVARRPSMATHQVRTVFFGGGTPTAMDEAQIGRAVGALRRHFDLSRVEEFTFESDPTTLTLGKLHALRAQGVNRLSIGIQSFSTETNLLNERKHSAEQSAEAISLARKAGFDNLNLDLICGLIGETDQGWRSTIDELLRVAPEHVTMYLFSFRPQTTAYSRVKHGRASTPPEEAARVEMYLHARRRLLAAGYTQTTPNCFVREPRFEQIHQRNAWSSLPLLGMGNSAYSFVNDCVTQNFRATSAWQKRIREGVLPVELGHRLNARELMVRYAVLRMKQLRIVRRDFRARFGFDVPEVFGPQLERLSGLGLITVTPEEVALTEQGIVYADDVCRMLYPPDVQEKLSRVESAPPPPLVRSLI